MQGHVRLARDAQVLDNMIKSWLGEMAMRFDIGAEHYRWLNTSLFIAKGRLIGTGSVECEVFRVT